MGSVVARGEEEDREHQNRQRPHDNDVRALSRITALAWEPLRSALGWAE